MKYIDGKPILPELPEDTDKTIVTTQFSVMDRKVAEDYFKQTIEGFDGYVEDVKCYLSGLTEDGYVRLVAIDDDGYEIESIVIDSNDETVDSELFTPEFLEAAIRF